MDHYFYGISQQAAEAAKDYGVNNIDPMWLYAQFAHESGNFTSRLTVENHNLGGLCQTTPNDSPQPDGDQYYMYFATFEDYAQYFGHYLRYFTDSGVDQATTIDEYVTALKNSPSGAYFGDSLENYLAGVHAVYDSLEVV